MSREIKFRGKRVDNSEWCFGYYNWSMGVHIITVVICEYPSHSDPGGCYIENSHDVIGDTIGEFTGITDVNGQEIYEGDCDAVGNVVEFVNGSWCLNGDRPLTSRFIKAGNIYEQKESN